MPPNLEDHLSRPPSVLEFFMGPTGFPDGPLSDDDSEDDIVLEARQQEELEHEQVLIPLEQNLEALLIQVTGTEHLNQVTQVKLRVIARDVPLQHLSLYIPALRELILDGSVVSTFRDLGCGLKNLKILRVNRCGLEFLDNMLGLEGLEELYAADNAIDSCVPLAFLSNIKVVDLRRNKLKNMGRTLPFLAMCEKLRHIYLEGNAETWLLPEYRQTVKRLLPLLRSLDGVSFTEDECNAQVAVTTRSVQETTNSNAVTPRVRSVMDAANGFTITFPPKVCLGGSGNSDKKS